MQRLMPRSLRLSLAVLTLALLAGCQQTPNKPQPPVTAQLDQLSALLASSQFLRQNCSRADIPAEAQLQQATLQVAKQRGWNTEVADYQQLPARVQTRYQALLQDSTPATEKCATLNRSTARFIAQAQAGQQ